MTPGEIQQRYGMHRDMIGGGWLKLKPGQVTDDTQMALTMGQAIIDSGGWNAPAAAMLRRLAQVKPVDVGNTCRRDPALPDRRHAGRARETKATPATAPACATCRWRWRRCMTTTPSPGQPGTRSSHDQSFRTGLALAHDAHLLRGGG